MDNGPLDLRQLAEPLTELARAVDRLRQELHQPPDLPLRLQAQETVRRAARASELHETDATAL